MQIQTYEVFFPKEASQKDQISFAEPRQTFTVGNRSPAITTRLNLTTVPKTGTHLLIKILYLLSVSFKMGAMDAQLAPHLLEYLLKESEGQEIDDDLKKYFYSDQKYLVTIRDPKDALISMLQWLDICMHDGTSNYEEGWDQTTAAELIHLALSPLENKKFNCLDSVRGLALNYWVAARLYQMNLPNVLFVKFEDLMGPDWGGSSKEIQLQTLKEICDFTEVKVSAEKLEQVVQEMMGGTLTFTDHKKVGKWKDCFTFEDMTLYLRTFYFIEQLFGYETYLPTVELDSSSIQV